MAHLRFSSKKVKVENFLAEFEKHQEDGYIGDPMGEDAYGSLRVSTDKQTEDWKTGIERQIESLHLAAKRDGVRVSWDMIYGDDDSGYLLDRPSLKELLIETARKPRATHIVFESISRMSRASQWQQGWLLEQFEDIRRMTVHFFDRADTPIERLVKGYLADEGMKQQIALMKSGRQKKAEKGFVDNGRGAFGFRLAAKEGYDPTKIREYATLVPLWEGDPESSNGCTRYGEANIIKEIFECIAYKGMTTHAVARLLNEKYGPPRNAIRWFSVNIWRMIQNTAYYGMYAKGRYDIHFENQLQDNGTVVRKKVRRERPQSEWTMVPVEPIVSKDVWDLANMMMPQNKKVSFRNTRDRDYLLTGLLKCWGCGYSWGAHKRRFPEKSYYYYQCSSRSQFRRDRLAIGVDCPQNISFRCEVLENAVWDIVRQVITSPDVLLRYLNSQLEDSANQDKISQIDYIHRQIEAARRSDKKDRELFDKGYMDIDEYGPKHKETIAQIGRWEVAIEDLEKGLITEDDVAQSKAQVMAISQSAREHEINGGDVPVDIKRTLIKLCVQVVYVDGLNQRIRVVGIIGDYTHALNGGNEGQDDGFVQQLPGQR